MLLHLATKCFPHYGTYDGLNITAFNTSHTNAVVNPTGLL